jgi:hypothetical protein
MKMDFEHKYLALGNDLPAQLLVLEDPRRKRPK